MLLHIFIIPTYIIIYSSRQYPLSCTFLQTLQSELITHQADLRFLELTAQKYVNEANNYKKRLMGFKAECQGTRSSLILEDENYSIKEDVAHAKYKFQELMSECGKQVHAYIHVY